MAEGHERSKTTVTIYGQQYTIIGREKEEQIREVATLVDIKMREIKKSNPSLSSSKLAVLTAVNIGNDYLNLLEKQDIEKKDEDL